MESKPTISVNGNIATRKTRPVPACLPQAGMRSFNRLRLGSLLRIGRRGLWLKTKNMTRRQNWYHSVYRCTKNHLVPVERLKSYLKKSAVVFNRTLTSWTGAVPSLKHSRMVSLPVPICPVRGSIFANSTPSGIGKS
jgi:hypothetical protein